MYLKDFDCVEKQNEQKTLEVSLIPYSKACFDQKFDFDRAIYDLDNQIKMLSSQADTLDYFTAIASGLLCGMLDIFWVGDFSLSRGRDIASENVDNFVKKIAQIRGCDKDDLQACVKFLEDNNHIPSDGNANEFGGGRQHHLRDFAHHPTIVGLMFSILTQFTKLSFGTDTTGKFAYYRISENSEQYIGKSPVEKIFNGTIVWFLHLVSDMAGSKITAGLSGGTGIPGPILSLAKELSALPFFRNMHVGKYDISLFLSKLFNGTLLAQHDENGRMIKDTVLKFDLRGELGLLEEVGRQALPVAANECIVRCFYFIRRFALELKEKQIKTISDLKKLNWDNVKPGNNPTLARMLTIATGVFTTVDVADAVASQKYFISINYVGVGRFALAIGEDLSWGMKARNVKEIRSMYEHMKKNTFRAEDKRVYERIGNDLGLENFSLTLEQSEILYNLGYYLVLNDIMNTNKLVGNDVVRELKIQWLLEWKENMTKGFSTLIQSENAQLHWYPIPELLKKIEDNNPDDIWFRLVLFEAMLIEPYYNMSIEVDKKGKVVAGKKYDKLKSAYNKEKADGYLASLFPEDYHAKTYITRFRKSYNKLYSALTRSKKGTIASVAVMATLVVGIAATAGLFAPSIAVMVAGSKFAGLGGVALTNACLAYLGGGAIAAGGFGMAGGAAAIAGGGGLLGICAGAGVGELVKAGFINNDSTIENSVKLLVCIKEIFLSDEKDLEFSKEIYERYVASILEIEQCIIDLRVKCDSASDEEKAELKKRIKNGEETIKTMKLARDKMLDINNKFETGLLLLE